MTFDSFSVPWTYTKTAPTSTFSVKVSETGSDSLGDTSYTDVATFTDTHHASDSLSAEFSETVHVVSHTSSLSMSTSGGNMILVHPVPVKTTNVLVEYQRMPQLFTTDFAGSNATARSLLFQLRGVSFDTASYRQGPTAWFNKITLDTRYAPTFGGQQSVLWTASRANVSNTSLTYTFPQRSTFNNKLPERFTVSFPPQVFLYHQVPSQTSFEIVILPGKRPIILGAASTEPPFVDLSPEVRSSSDTISLIAATSGSLLGVSATSLYLTRSSALRSVANCQGLATGLTVFEHPTQVKIAMSGMDPMLAPFLGAVVMNLVLAAAAILLHTVIVMLYYRYVTSQPPDGYQGPPMTWKAAMSKVSFPGKMVAILLLFPPTLKSIFVLFFSGASTGAISIALPVLIVWLLCLGWMLYKILSPMQRFASQYQDYAPPSNGRRRNPNSSANAPQQASPPRQRPQQSGLLRHIPYFFRPRGEWEDSTQSPDGLFTGLFGDFFQDYRSKRLRLFLLVELATASVVSILDGVVIVWQLCVGFGIAIAFTLLIHLILLMWWRPFTVPGNNVFFLLLCFVQLLLAIVAVVAGSGKKSVVEGLFITLTILQFIVVAKVICDAIMTILVQRDAMVNDDSNTAARKGVRRSPYTTPDTSTHASGEEFMYTQRQPIPQQHHIEEEELPSHEELSKGRTASSVLRPSHQRFDPSQYQSTEPEPFAFGGAVYATDGWAASASAPDPETVEVLSVPRRPTRVSQPRYDEFDDEWRDDNHTSAHQYFGALSAPPALPIQQHRQSQSQERPFAIDISGIEHHPSFQAVSDDSEDPFAEQVAYSSPLAHVPQNEGYRQVDPLSWSGSVLRSNRPYQPTMEDDLADIL